MINHYIPCMECQRETGIPNLTFFDKKEQNNKLAYEITCNKGHTSIVIQQAFRFEILFDMACISYLNKDYTSVVKHCATSIERFHECFIQSVWFSDDKPFAELEESYKLYWKQIKHSSERQLGSFYSFYLKRYQKLDYDITYKKASFRNGVVHTGYICNESETYNYLELSYNYMYCILKQIHEDLKKGFYDAITYNLKQISSKYPNNQISTFCDFHIISSIMSDEIKSPKPLKNKLKEYQDYENLMNSLFPFISKSFFNK
ncbi:hypothetical protein [Phascolarctobacterium sp.]